MVDRVIRAAADGLVGILADIVRRTLADIVRRARPPFVERIGRMSAPTTMRCDTVVGEAIVGVMNVAEGAAGVTFPPVDPNHFAIDVMAVGPVAHVRGSGHRPLTHVAGIAVRAERPGARPDARQMIREIAAIHAKPGWAGDDRSVQNDSRRRSLREQSSASASDDAGVPES